MIQTEDLTFQYKKGVPLFSFPNITLADQENLLILGKSGIGKTTFLHLLAGLLTPISGKIIINDTDINALSNSKMDVFRGQNIGLVFQKNYAVRSLNVLENIQARLFFSKKKVDNSQIEQLLKQLELDNCRNSKVNQISEGQLQRLNIALSVIHKPKVILADEPTSSLDDDNCNIVIDLLIAQARQTNANLIVITHDHRIQPYFQNIITL